MARELVGIQYLRGVAATLVVAYHLGPQLVRLGHPGAATWPSGLSGGVDIFFVISGFIMWVTTAGRTVTPGQFWLNRIVRIVPLYWLVTTLMVAIMLAAPSLMQSSRYDLAHVVSSYLFVPWRHPTKPKMWPVVMPGWTLNYEMFFYALFGLGLLLPAAARIVWIIGGLCAVVFAGAIVGAPALTPLGFYSSTIVLEFAFGIVLAVAFLGRRGLDIRPALGWGVVSLAFVVLIAMPLPDARLQALFYGLPALAIVTATLALERRRRFGDSRLLHALGNASYSIYLTQIVTMAAFTAAWHRAHLDRLPGDAVLYCVAAMVVTLAVGWACHRLVEAPVTAALKRLLGRSADRLRASGYRVEPGPSA